MRGAKSLKEIINEGRVWFGGESSLQTLHQEILRQGLPRGTVHEWFYEMDVPFYSPPFFLLAKLITLSRTSAKKNTVLWIGRRFSPTAYFLNETLSETTSLFLHPQGKKERIWATIEALRCPSLLAVIADGSGLNLTVTRQLQLAAKKGSTLGFLLRPQKEIFLPTAATSKWKVSPLPSSTSQPYWTLELLYYKGLKPNELSIKLHFERIREVHYEKNSLRVFSSLVNRPDILLAEKASAEQCSPDRPTLDNAVPRRENRRSLL